MDVLFEQILIRIAVKRKWGEHNKQRMVLRTPPIYRMKLKQGVGRGVSRGFRKPPCKIWTATGTQHTI